MALRISAGSESVEEGPVGFAAVEERADAVVGEAAESEGGAVVRLRPLKPCRAGQWEDRADEATGEVVPLMVVTDDGLAMKSVAVARWFAGQPHLSHVRTRHRDPHTQTEPTED